MNTVPTDLPAGQMTKKVVSPEQKDTRGRNRAILFGIIALAIACFAVSSQSLWIDEAASASKAVQPTFSTWWHLMYTENGSDKQMPLYMFAIWVWQGFGPPTEWWLRAAGIPFFVAGLYFFAGCRVERWLVGIFSAFAWYCLDEARPYAMQLGASLACFGSLEQLAGNLPPRSERKWLGVFLVSVIVLSGSSLLGMIWSAAVLGALAVIQINKARPWDLACGHKRLWLPGALVMSALALFYLWTMRTAGASLVGRTDWRNLVFVISEVFGFTGLGPGRLELRVGGAGALRPYILPLLAFAIPTAIVAAAGLWRARKSLTDRRGLLLAALVAAALATLLAIGVVKHFRVLGRHCTPVLPVVLWILAEGVVSLWQSRKFFQRFLVVAFLIGSVASCLSFRLATRHAKDDYREAAHLAQAAVEQGQMVWWAADHRGGVMYGLQLPKDGTLAEVLGKVEPGSAVLIWNCPKEQLEALPPPQLVSLSKPDLFDPLGTLTAFLQTHHYVRAEQMPAFEIWRPSAPPAGSPGAATPGQ